MAERDVTLGFGSISNMKINQKRKDKKSVYTLRKIIQLQIK